MNDKIKSQKAITFEFEGRKFLVGTIDITFDTFFKRIEIDKINMTRKENDTIDTPWANPYY